MTYRLSLRETSYLCTFLSYIVYPCQTQDDGCHIPFLVNLREEEMPRYMFHPVITKATTIYPRTAGTSLTMPDAGFLLSPLLGQAVPVAEYVTSTTRSTPAHYMGNISMEVRCIFEDTVVHHARLHTHYISIEICSNSNSDASFASRHMPISTSSGYHPDVGAVEKTAFSRATFAPVTMSPLASFPPPKYGPIWRESTVRRLTSPTTTTTPDLDGLR